MNHRLVLAVAGMALGTLVGCGPPEEPCGPASGTVERVVDGDTIDLSSGERIRYLLVDTPETTGEVGCFGPEAKDFNTDLVLGAQVTLRYDEAVCRDRFDRLLAYVSVQGREVNSLLVERGYACTLFIAPAGEDRRVEFQDLERAAKQLQRGMWAACEVIACD